MNQDKILHLDTIVHAPVRLAILSILVTAENANFTFLREATKTTDGNLNTHLTKLEQSGYIRIKKTFKGKKPQTICSISRKGAKAFELYLEQLDQIVRRQKNKT
ncbi:transcriptional regulator [bacterium]|nr:transcriptional regulator [bacterium]